MKSIDSSTWVEGVERPLSTFVGAIESHLKWLTRSCYVPPDLID